MPDKEYFEQCKQLQADEHHFNDIEIGLRKLASGWLLAALGAIAFIVQGAYITDGGSNLMLSPNSLIIIICCMANLGLYLLWQLDQMAYHKLLDAVFYLGLSLEQKYPDKLPPIRIKMREHTRGISKYVRWYYLLPMLVFGIIAIVFSISVMINNQTAKLYDYPLPIFLGVVTIFIFVLAYSQNRMTNKQQEKAKLSIGN